MWKNLGLSTLRPVDKCVYRPCVRTRQCYPRRDALSNTACARRLSSMNHHDPSHMVCSCKTKHGASLHPSPSNHTDVPKSNLRSLGKLERTEKMDGFGVARGATKVSPVLGLKNGPKSRGSPAKPIMDFIGGALKSGSILVPRVWGGLEAHAVLAAEPCWCGCGCAYLLLYFQALSTAGAASRTASPKPAATARPSRKK